MYMPAEQSLKRAKFYLTQNTSEQEYIAANMKNAASHLSPLSSREVVTYTRTPKKRSDDPHR